MIWMTKIMPATTPASLKRLLNNLKRPSPGAPLYAVGLSMVPKRPAAETGVMSNK